MNIYETPPIACPGCGTPIDGHLTTTPGQTGPDDGSVVICVYCSTIGIYITADNQLQLRYPTDDELQTLLKNPNVARCIAALRIARET